MILTGGASAVPSSSAVTTASSAGPNMTTLPPTLGSVDGVVTTVPTRVMTYSEKFLSNAPNFADFLRASHRSEEHTSELQSLMRISYAVFCLKKKKDNNKKRNTTTI